MTSICSTASIEFKKINYFSCILFVFIFISCFGYSQQFEIYKGDTINRVTIENKKEGKWIYFGKPKIYPDMMQSRL